MSLVDTLLNNSEADLGLLKSNQEKGDPGTEFREVDFIFYTKDRKNGEMICSFMHDNSYGRGFYQEIAENPESHRHRVVVTINMPTTPHIACSVSGLMACIAHLFGIEYDGWGCPLKEK
jgi:hypothetical protein